MASVARNTLLPLVREHRRDRHRVRRRAEEPHRRGDRHRRRRGLRREHQGVDHHPRPRRDDGLRGRLRRAPRDALGPRRASATSSRRSQSPLSRNNTAGPPARPGLSPQRRGEPDAADHRGPRVGRRRSSSSLGRRAWRCPSSSRCDRCSPARWIPRTSHRTSRPTTSRRAKGRWMDKLRVVLLFGGRSSEHSISCATAGGVLRAIDRDRYEVIPVGITRDGAFVLEADDPERFALDPEHLPEVVDNGTRVRWPESAASRDADGVGCRGRAFPRRRRPRLPDPARPVRRGRHRAGPARARRPAVRRQRRARVGDRHGQARHEDRARGCGHRRSRRGSRSRARRSPPTPTCGAGARVRSACRCS